MAFITRPSVRTRYIEATDRKSPSYNVVGSSQFNSITVSIPLYKSSPSEEQEAAQAWLDKFHPGTEVVGPGLMFRGDTYWTWTNK
jgi:hypothetical protein